jgi:hypothetical protein
MEWAVVWMSGPHKLARPLARTNSPQREREMRRREDVPAPEMRLQKPSDGC